MTTDHHNRCLVTDMDGTFIGDDEAMFELWQQLQRQGILLGFSTGRHLASIEDFYQEKQARSRADFCICMVGTDVYFKNDGEYELDTAWHEIIRRQWNKSAVESILSRVVNAHKQDDQWQSEFKSSYYLENNVESSLNQIQQELHDAHIDAKVVYSAGRFLDILPARSGKGEAVRYVADKLGLSPDQVVTSGDTGNDIDMMREELGFRCIIVGNAAEELKSLQAEHIYHAEANYAGGIQEGLKSYGWL